ncbi:flagellar hook-basal body complex protein [Arsenicitalea aurantiaca]|uniref:Flagellar hook protein FlgE n=1 Tax=Arsenicitalea aurantiaca TaxID=1783274 RepID=A0A433XGF5_9HYPH|nr:flagellar hook-basal body complex protein [Arsenicitalea aurantiaca]RUT33140.1 flagellar hook-basal body complex protein [Arsenicitalea aurantiaca]
MGIYGALSTAVTGLRAQAFALENISGNIANSQTTGFKRIDTDFLDLIADAPQSRMAAGSVLAQSRSTNDVQGDIKTASKETYMAINGSGFFVVEPPISQSDGVSVFAGTSLYTRRGDFEINKDGYLVNGAGQYLKGLPINATTGNISGSVPEVIQLSNAFLPANQTTRINYQLNLPQLPKNGNYQQSKALGSELFIPSTFTSVTPDTPATATGATLTGTDAASSVMLPGESLTVTVDGADVIFDFYDSSVTGNYTGGNLGIDVSSATIAQALQSMQDGLRGAGGAAASSATVGLDDNGALAITAGANTIARIGITDGTTGLALTDGNYTPLRPSLGVRVATIPANKSGEFIAQSVAGGAITTYASNGAPASVEMRWVKIDSAETGGVERWNLFYMSDKNATGGNPMWTNVGTDYTFAGNGELTPPIESVTLTGLTVNGVTVGNVVLQHGKNGVTQFADTNGTSQVTALSQNGYGAGEFVSAAINDSGRVVVSYSNGQQVEVAQVVIAQFNAPNQLKRMDGGVFAATSQSGEAIFSSEGGIISASLESSNTDISEEFTKLIVTQQAYAASTRIVSTADEMLQEALNMVR